MTLISFLSLSPLLIYLITTTILITTVITAQPSDGLFIESVQLAPNGWHEVAARTVPPHVAFLLFQVHNQRHNVTIAYANYQGSPPSEWPRGQYITGLDVGLVKMMPPPPPLNGTVGTSPGVSMWIANPNNFTIMANVIVSSHERNEPIPGGCNMEFSVEISPFLRLSTDPSQSRVTIEFQHARAAPPPSSQSIAPISCDTSYYMISYDIYAYYLAENDYTAAEYQRALARMSNATEILRYATKVDHFDLGPRTRTSLMAYPGRGVVYNVLASVGEKGPLEPYVPILTYGCDFSSNIDGCGRLNSIVGKIFMTILGLWGLVVALRGHQWFQTQLAFYGFLGASIPTFILLAKCSSLYPDERDVIMFIAGLLGAILWVLIWRLSDAPTFSVMLGGLLLGFLSVAAILFTRLGNEEIFRRDVNYWLLLSCGTLIVPILLLPFRIILSVFSGSVVGSYAFIMAIDRYVGGSLSYIVFNVFKRAIYEDIYMASNQVPFQPKDEILAISWLLLALIGIALQIYGSFGQPPYPSPADSNFLCFGRGGGRGGPRRSSRIRLFVSGTNVGGGGPRSVSATRQNSDDLEASDQYSWRISEIRHQHSTSTSHKSRSRKSTPPPLLVDEHSPLIGSSLVARAQREVIDGDGSSTPRSSRSRTDRRPGRISPAPPPPTAGGGRLTTPSTSRATAPPLPPPADTLIYADYDYGAMRATNH